jgi:hypothetical protein
VSPQEIRERVVVAEEDGHRVALLDIHGEWAVVLFNQRFTHTDYQPRVGDYLDVAFVLDRDAADPWQFIRLVGISDVYRGDVPSIAPWLDLLNRHDPADCREYTLEWLPPLHLS